MSKLPAGKGTRTGCPGCSRRTEHCTGDLDSRGSSAACCRPGPLALEAKPYCLLRPAGDAAVTTGTQRVTPVRTFL